MSDAAVQTLLRALCFAAEKHRDQRRKGAGAPPFINHAIEVAEILANVAEVRDPATLAGAVLHDTIEDTDTTGAEIEALFGSDVRMIVEEVSDDTSLPLSERQRLQVERTPSISDPAKLVRLADKISNVRAVGSAPPVGWTVDRRRDYLLWTARVVEGCRGTSDALDLLYDRALAKALERLEEPDAAASSGRRADPNVSD